MHARAQGRIARTERAGLPAFRRRAHGWNPEARCGILGSPYGTPQHVDYGHGLRSASTLAGAASFVPFRDSSVNPSRTPVYREDRQVSDIQQKDHQTPLPRPLWHAPNVQTTRASERP